MTGLKYKGVAITRTADAVYVAYPTRGGQVRRVSALTMKAIKGMISAELDRVPKVWTHRGIEITRRHDGRYSAFVIDRDILRFTLKSMRESINFHLDPKLHHCAWASCSKLFSRDAEHPVYCPECTDKMASAQEDKKRHQAAKDDAALRLKLVPLMNALHDFSFASARAEMNSEDMSASEHLSAASDTLEDVLVNLIKNQ